MRFRMDIDVMVKHGNKISNFLIDFKKGGYTI